MAGDGSSAGGIAAVCRVRADYSQTWNNSVAENNLLATMCAPNSKQHRVSESGGKRWVGGDAWTHVSADLAAQPKVHPGPLPVTVRIRTHRHERAHCQPGQAPSHGPSPGGSGWSGAQ